MSSDEKKLLPQAIAALEKMRGKMENELLDLTLRLLQKELATLSAPAESRKLVTILFSDLSGFTSMSEKLDPEEVREIMRLYFKRMTDIITARSGVIEKFIGDAIMAVFGLPHVSEDDAENAVTAALQMQIELEKINDEFRDEWGFDLRMRIGINTGFVLARFSGGRESRDFRVFGDTVNTASRLESSAPVGGVLISHDTKLHTQEKFELRPQEPLDVKGKADAIQTYLVTRRRAYRFRPSESGLKEIATPLVGREKELSWLQENWQQISQEKSARLLTVIGDAGIGKSRLLYEFRQWVQENGRAKDAKTLRARGSQRLQNQPYALLRDLFSESFNILESDPKATVREKMEQGMSTLVGHSDETRMQSHIIGQFLGFDFRNSPFIEGIRKDSRQIRLRAVTYMGRVLQTIATQYPLLVILEDIHWADEASLEVIGELVENLGHLPSLILCMTRPSLFERIPDWNHRYIFQNDISLSPLNHEQSNELVRGLLQKVVNMPQALQDLVTERAEGNPYYVEELIKMLLEDGVIIQTDGQWQVNSFRLEHVRIPSTLTGILQARLDSLNNEERITLQQASVIGRIFWDGSLSYLQSFSKGIDKGNLVTHMLHDLSQRDLVFQQEQSAFAQTQEYIFKHNLLRDVAYESVLKKDRRAYHARIAEWLIAQTGDRTSEYASLIAEHLENAGQTKRAISYLLQAGIYAKNAHAYQEALNFYHRALELVNDTDLFDCMNITRKIGKTLVNKGEFEKASQYLQESLQFAQQLDNPLELAITMRYYSIPVRRMGNLEEAEKNLDQSIDIAQKLEDDFGIAESSRELGWLYLFSGRQSEAKEAFNRAVHYSRRLGNRNISGLINALGGLGALAHMEGDYHQAQKHHSECLHRYGKMGDRWGIAVSLSSLGEVARLQQNFPVAEQYYREALFISKELGNMFGVATLLDNLGHALLGQARVVEAADFYQQSIEQSLAIGAIPVALDALAGWAGLKFNAGAKQLALNMLGVALHHPNSDDEVQVTAAPILAKLNERLGETAVTTALKEGAKIQLSALMEQLTNPVLES